MDHRTKNQLQKRFLTSGFRTKVQSLLGIIPTRQKKSDRKKENESFICVLSLDKNEFWIKGKRKDHKQYILHTHI